MQQEVKLYIEYMCQCRANGYEFNSVGLLEQHVYQPDGEVSPKLASTRSAADLTKKWLQAREGNQLNYPFTKLVISQPIKSGKEIPFGFRWLRLQ
jgi:hypothetical protein